MKNKFQLGKLYKIRFYDHCVGISDKMICEAVGWVIKDDPHHVVITSWIVDTKDKEVKDENIEPTTIVKTCIIRKRKLA